MRVLFLLFTIAILSACVATLTPNPTYTPYPTYTSNPTYTPIPFDEAFADALYARIEIDDTIPPSGKGAVIALIGNQPTFAFRDNRGIILQFNVFDMPDNEPEITKTAQLLIGTGFIVAAEHSIPLEGIEVVFYTKEQEPWLALALGPPWNTNDLILAPLHPEYIKRLQKMGLITPTPKSVY